MKEKLSNFLPDLPGMIDLPGSHDNSSLRSLIEKPPILGGSFNPITGTMLSGFRLHTGPVSPFLGSKKVNGLKGMEVVFCPSLFLHNLLRTDDGGEDFFSLLTRTVFWFPQLPEQCRLMHIQPPKKKNKHKHKQSRTQDPVPPGKEHLLFKQRPCQVWSGLTVKLSYPGLPGFPQKEIHIVPFLGQVVT